MRVSVLAFMCTLAGGQLCAFEISAIGPNRGFVMPDNIRPKGEPLQASFDTTALQISAIYGPVVRQNFGATLRVTTMWTNPYLNAYADRPAPGLWRVNLFGGLFYRTAITGDAFALVACHELGHHLAGAPYVNGWASAEGQSDYFAMSCLRNLWGAQLAQNKLVASRTTEYVTKLCSDVWPSVESQNLCARVIAAGDSFANFLGAEANVETPDLSEVTETNAEHPNAQCRLDTYVAGALNKPRPACWFKP